MFPTEIMPRVSALYSSSPSTGGGRTDTVRVGSEQRAGGTHPWQRNYWGLFGAQTLCGQYNTRFQNIAKSRAGPTIGW